MSDPIYVQHFSKTGPVYKAIKYSRTAFYIHTPTLQTDLYLPAGPDGYVEVPKPEVWEGVECSFEHSPINNAVDIVFDNKIGTTTRLYLSKGYRLKSIEIEKRQE